MKELIIATLFLLIAIPTVTACLTAEEIDTLTNISTITNTSSGQLIAIFTKLCERDTEWNVTKGYIDDELENITENVENLSGRVDNINSTIDNRLDNYTSWVDNKTNYMNVLENLTVALNKSLSQDWVLRQIDTKKLELEEIFDEKLLDLKEGFAAHSDLRDLELNLTSLIYQTKQENPSNPWLWLQYNYGWVFLAIVVVIILGWKFRGQLRGQVVTGPYPRHRIDTDDISSFGMGPERAEREGLLKDKKIQSELDKQKKERMKKAADEIAKEIKKKEKER